jgi:hypothetical protein
LSPATGRSFADCDPTQNLAGFERVDKADMLHPQPKQRLDLGCDRKVLLIGRQAGCFDAIAPAQDRCRSLSNSGPSVAGISWMSCVIKQFDKGLETGRWLRETLENPSNPRENTLVIAGTDWAHGQQAARIQ